MGSGIVGPSGVWWKNAGLYQRLAALAFVILLCWLFRQLAVLLISFFLTARGLSFFVDRLSPLFRGRRNITLVVVLILILGFLTLTVLIAVSFGSGMIRQVWSELSQRDILQYIRDMKMELLVKLPPYVPLDGIIDFLTSYSKDIVKLHGVSYAGMVGRAILYVLIGAVIAIIYLFDQQRVDSLFDQLRSGSFFWIVRNNIRYIRDAILITVKLQILVAIVNTLLTIPVLFLLQLPRLGFLIGVIFFSSLIPILGNFISGAVLIAFSYLHQGVVGVIVFLSITAILHKIEAYYLNPRLASKHVRLPTVILIFSLIGFEHLFGLVGIFLSFPSLYVGIKVYEEIKHAVAATP